MSSLLCGDCTFLLLAGLLAGQAEPKETGAHWRHWQSLSGVQKCIFVLRFESILFSLFVSVCSSSVLGTVLETVLESLLESVLESVLECAEKSTEKTAKKCAQKCAQLASRP